MTMSPDFTNYYDIIFDYVTEGPVLIYGVHKNVAENQMPEKYQGVTDFSDWFKKRNIDAYTLDLFDKEASYNFDLNDPVPVGQLKRYNAVIDIGTIEHIFDVKQVLHNSFGMVKENGYYILQTTANGLYEHGFYAFGPELIQSTLRSNGFDVLYFKTSNLTGVETNFSDVFAPMQPSMVMWVVAKRVKVLEKFVNPQQDQWKNLY